MTICHLFVPGADALDHPQNIRVWPHHIGASARQPTAPIGGSARVLTALGSHSE